MSNSQCNLQTSPVKWRLTQIWLVLVACNLLLQFDFAEQWFDQMGPQSQATITQLECSTLLQLKSQQPSSQHFLALFGTGMFSSSSNQWQSSGHSEASSSLKQTSLSKVLDDTTTWSIKLLPKESSGLSPPTIG